MIYPKHGIGQIISVDKLTIAGIEASVYKIEITKDKLNLTIPTNQQQHLRPLSSSNQINKALSILKGKAKIKRTMWSRRAAEYEQKINSGDIYQIAEVVRDLNKILTCQLTSLTVNVNCLKKLMIDCLVKYLLY